MELRRIGIGKPNRAGHRCVHFHRNRAESFAARQMAASCQRVYFRYQRGHLAAFARSMAVYFMLDYRHHQQIRFHDKGKAFVEPVELRHCRFAYSGAVRGFDVVRAVG